MNDITSMMVVLAGSLIRKLVYSKCAFLHLYTSTLFMYRNRLFVHGFIFLYEKNVIIIVDMILCKVSAHNKYKFSVR
jgi:hypothetical protein